MILSNNTKMTSTYIDLTLVAKISYDGYKLKLWGGHNVELLSHPIESKEVGKAVAKRLANRKNSTDSSIDITKVIAEAEEYINEGGEA